MINNKIKRARRNIETLSSKDRNSPGPVQVGETKSEISKAVEAILESIVEAVALDEKVEIRGFGTFSKKFIRPRKFINPKTKKISYLGETATLHFKPSKLLIKI